MRFEPPPFQANGVVPTLANAFAYVERWTPGSRARARMVTLRGAGLRPTSSTLRRRSAGGVVEVTEIRIEPMPGFDRIPAVAIEDMLPPALTRSERAAAHRADVEIHEEG